MEYLLIAQDRIVAEHYVRQNEEAWLLAEARSVDQAMELVSIGCILRLAQVYDKVDLQTAAGAASA